jgi:hypothetical protein
MEPALWPVFRCRHFSKKGGSIQWVESAFYFRLGRDQLFTFRGCDHQLYVPSAPKTVVA